MSRQFLLAAVIAAFSSLAPPSARAQGAAARAAGAPPFSMSAQVPHRGGPDTAKPNAEATRAVEESQGLIGEATPRAGAVAGRPTLAAVRVAQAPNIDGRLDDAIWLTAALIDTFVQEEPVEGEPATEKTEVRVAYDSEKLYFGIHAHYSDVSLRRANRSDRDKLDDDDTVTIYLEPFLDYLRGYSFSVNGYGVQQDSMIVVINAQDDPEGDTSWNVLFSSGGQLVEDGWTAEMAIPIKSLRYPSRKQGEAHRWGFQVRRKITSKDERDVWAPVSRNVMSFLAQIGILDEITNLSAQRNFEALPTFTAVRSGRLDTTTGGFVSDAVQEGGVSVKYGLNSNLTFDFTYNPDFSNIESETQQIEVNQRFPINYPELRPFFLEGQEIYQIPGAVTPVHTRTIVDPRYGAKLSGKIGRTSIGMFFADDEAAGKVEDPADRAFGRSAKVVLGRAKYDLYRNAHIGAIFTAREFLNSFSRLVGIDAALRIGDNHNFTTRLYKSDRRDENEGRRTGWSMDTSFRKEGRNLRYGIVHYDTSPDFGNQLSFVRRVDQKVTNPSISYRWWPESWILNWGPGFGMPRTYDFEGVLQNKDYNPSVSFLFAKNISLNASVTRSMERYRDIDFDKTRWSASGSVNSSRQISLSANISGGDQIRFVTNPFLGSLVEYGVSATFRPVSRLQSVLKLDANRFSDPVNHAQEFNVKIVRSTTTYQFTPRLLARNISEFNTGIGSNHTIFENILVTYRVNSGTVFYMGYDDRFKQGDTVDPNLSADTVYQRTNRAVFTKIQYLFRSGENN